MVSPPGRPAATVGSRPERKGVGWGGGWLCGFRSIHMGLCVKAGLFWDYCHCVISWFDDTE